MRSLFLKIFLWYWLSVVCLILVSFAVTYQLRSDSLIEPFRVSSPQFAADAQSAASIYERQGRGGLARYIGRLARTTDIHAYLFDYRGVRLAGPRPSAKILSLESNARKRIYYPGLFLSRFYRIQPAMGPSGKWYTFISEAHPRTDDHTALFIRMGVIVVTAAFICWRLTRHITKPIGALREATRQIASGRFSTRVGDAVGWQSDELGRLAQDFDKMAGQLESLLASQHRLLADISHELRSPLARLNVALEIARRDGIAAAPAALDRIERESQRLNELIAELTTITRLENGVNLDQARDVDLAALVKDIVLDADYEARSHGNRTVTLTEVPGEAPIVLFGELELLRRAIENVIRNAVKYTADSTNVEVALAVSGKPSTGQTCTITVRDHGRGVPENAVRDIFKPFYRLDDARDRQSGGVGLGLAIVERAVALHGGMTSAENAHGGGLLVTLTLPLGENSVRPQSSRMTLVGKRLRH